MASKPPPFTTGIPLPQPFPLVIVGGNSLVAPYFMKRLNEMGLVADVISRSMIDVPKGFTFTQMDLTQARNWIAPENAVIVSMLPLWVLTQFLPRFIGVKSIIALGATSPFSKTRNNNPKEHSLAEALETAEGLLQTWCKRSNVHGTLIRPTLIYDGVHDNNVARLAHFIRRYHFLPLAAPAKGLRQPIHADDVAKALITCLDNEAIYNKNLTIAGGEILTCRVLVERVFKACNIEPRFLMLSSAWLQRAYRAAAYTGLIHEASFSRSIFQRMNEDLLFDTTEGLRLLNYQPRDFHPQCPE